MSAYRAWGYGLVFMLTSSIGQGQIYESVDGQGDVMFSDVPQTHSQPYDLSSAQISGFSGAATLPESAVITKESVDPAVTASAYTVAIVQPQDQTTIHNQAPVTVVASVQPSLKTGDQLQLLVDGLPMGEPQTSLQFTLPELIRGTHQLQVRLMDANGQTLKMSLPVTLFKQQASVLLPTTPPA